MWVLYSLREPSCQPARERWRVGGEFYFFLTHTWTHAHTLLATSLASLWSAIIEWKVSEALLSPLWQCPDDALSCERERESVCMCVRSGPRSPAPGTAYPGDIGGEWGPYIIPLTTCLSLAAPSALLECSAFPLQSHCRPPSVITLTCPATQHCVCACTCICLPAIKQAGKGKACMWVPQGSMLGPHYIWLALFNSGYKRHWYKLVH